MAQRSAIDDVELIISRLELFFPKTARAAYLPVAFSSSYTTGPISNHRPLLLRRRLNIIPLSYVNLAGDVLK
jgi:hypothetical protein